MCYGLGVVMVGVLCVLDICMVMYWLGLMYVWMWWINNLKWFVCCIWCRWVIWMLWMKFCGRCMLCCIGWLVCSCVRILVSVFWVLLCWLMRFIWRYLVVVVCWFGRIVGICLVWLCEWCVRYLLMLCVVGRCWSGCSWLIVLSCWRFLVCLFMRWIMLFCWSVWKCWNRLICGRWILCWCVFLLVWWLSRLVWLWVFCWLLYSVNGVLFEFGCSGNCKVDCGLVGCGWVYFFDVFYVVWFLVVWLYLFVFLFLLNFCWISKRLFWLVCLCWCVLILWKGL